MGVTVEENGRLLDRKCTGLSSYKSILRDLSNPLVRMDELLTG